MFKKQKLVILLCTILMVSCAHAGPWLMPGDVSVKSDVDLLASYDFIKAPVLTWPIAWQNIGPALLSPESKEKLKTSPTSVKQAYQRILALYQSETKLNTQQSSVTSGGGSNINPFPMFQARPRADFTAGYATEYQTTRYAGNLSLSYGKYNDFNDYFHVDGSYLDYFMGNWSLGFDKINRWWGPGYSDSMILSENATPMPSLTFQRMGAYPFETKWLSWMGPWTLTTSFSELDAARPYPNALNWFSNVSFKPLDSLEVGVSRVVLFAGEGNPLNWTMFRNIITFQGACPAGKDANYCLHDLQGKQHVDLSLKWDLYNTWSVPVDLYLDTGFNDTAPPGYTIKQVPIRYPARTAFLLGADTWKQTHYGLFRVYTEYEYNLENVYYFWGQQESNIYGGNYPYTYYGSLLATPLGSDAVGYTLGGILNEPNNDSDTASVRLLRINPYNQPVDHFGYDYARQNLVWSSLGRTFPLPKQWGTLSAELGYLYALQTGQNRLNSGASVGLVWQKQLSM